MAVMKMAEEGQPLRWSRDGKPVWAENEVGKAVCGATRQDGGLCEGKWLEKNGRCKYHQDQPGGGPGAAKTEREVTSRSLSVASKLTPKLREAFQESLDDPEQQSVKVELALLDTNLMRLMDQMQNTPDAGTWEVVASTVQLLDEALEEEDLSVITRCSTTLRRLASEGSIQRHIWDEIKQHTQLRAKLVDTETKRLQAAKSSLTIQEALMLVTALFRIMAKHVSDEAALVGIRNDMIEVLAIPAKAIEVGEEDSDTVSPGDADEGGDAADIVSVAGVGGGKELDLLDEGYAEAVARGALLSPPGENTGGSVVNTAD
jgi:uncharacterized protein (DUF2267 family)